MIFDSGTTNVATAGTEVQISNTTNKVRWIKVKALAANSGIAYFGVSDISATNGYELSAGNTLEINFGEQGGTGLLVLSMLTLLPVEIRLAG